MKERASRFLIIAGAITAFGLPFAIAFPRGLLFKGLAIAALVAAASAVAAAVMAMRKQP
jgi:hypothetical protein